MLGHLISPESDTMSTETQIKYQTQSEESVVDGRFHVLSGNMLNR